MGEDIKQQEVDEEAPPASQPRFEDTLPDYQQPKRYVKEEKSEKSKAPKVMIMGTDPSNMCKECGKRVYEMEKIAAEKAVFHKSCFKCCHCKRVLSLKNYASLDGEMFCKPHFIELFKSKGNYEEGFGKERKTRQWAQYEAPKLDKPGPDSGETEQLESTIEIVRAEDKVEDEIENLPSIRNLKYRFESQDSGSPTIDITRKPAQTRAPQKENGYAQMDTSMEDEQVQSSASSMVHTAYGQQYTTGTPSGAKKSSKWDKPKEPPPPPVNRKPDGEEDEEPMYNEEELPPVAMTRSLVSRFQGSGHGEWEANVQRKPVRKITPPREEIERGIEEYHRSEESQGRDQSPERDPNIVRSGERADEEKELPPSGFSRGLLAKFQSMEEVNAQPPSPAKKAPKLGSTRKVSGSETITIETNTQVRQSSRASPDSGISLPDNNGSSSQIPLDMSDGGVYENQPGTNEEVVRSGEDTAPEKELPEQGFTRNLLAQWRNIERSTPEPSPAPKPKKQWSQPRAAPAAPKPELNMSSSSLDPQVDGHFDERTLGEAPESPRDVVRESDQNEEEYLPPPSFTKNMLARFQSLESNPSTPSQPTPKRQFKWQVKEAHVLARPGASAHIQPHPISKQHEDQQPIRSSQSDDNIYEEPVSYDQDDDIIHSDDQVVLEKELPPPATTRNLLAKFQSFEDDTLPPPSPQRTNSTKRSTHKAATRSHYSENEQGEYYEEREQPDGVEYDSYNQSEAHLDLGEGGEYVHEGYHDPNVIREEDNHDEEELPEQGTTRNLLAKFQSMQAAH